jgi:TM2 domain-containing membrane protein YozV
LDRLARVEPSVKIHKFYLLSPFWNGFMVGAILFSIVGTFAGIWVVAMCQAAADDDHGRDLIDNTEQQYRRTMTDFQLNGDSVRSASVPVNNTY